MTPRAGPRKAALPRPMKLCAQCARPIAEQRPVYLVSLPGGRIVGPFHAGCAEHISLGLKKGREAVGLEAGETYGAWPSRREETLPE